MTDKAKRDETTLANELRTQLLALLAGGQAHADFEKVIADMPEALRGEKPGGVPYSAWQLLEHLRITQRDILDFSTNREGAGYKELEWPAQYWPEESSPPTATAWEESLLAIRSDQQAFAALLQAKDADLATPLPGVMDRTCCARRYCLQTTLPTTWVRWCCCGACSEHGTSDGGKN